MSRRRLLFMDIIRLELSVAVGNGQGVVGDVVLNPRMLRTETTVTQVREMSQKLDGFVVPAASSQLISVDCLPAIGLRRENEIIWIYVRKSVKKQ